MWFAFPTTEDITQKLGLTHKPLGGAGEETHSSPFCLVAADRAWGGALPPALMGLTG